MRFRSSRALLLAAALMVGACGRAVTTVPADRRPYRFAEQQTTFGDPPDVSILGVQRPVLDNQQDENRFPLERLPPQPVLVFSTGVQPVPEGGAVRFDILLKEAAGKITLIFSKEASEPGWANERVDLSDRNLAGAEITFRRTPVSGGFPRLLASYWGNPMLVPSEPARAPSVILVSLDTLRADRLGAYGYPAARSPALDRIGAAGVVYEDAYSPSTWTVPSHASLFFGLHIPTTVTNLTQKNLLPKDTAIANRPLASILRDNGYLTAGFTGGGFLSSAYDFPRGHDVFLQYSQGRKPVTGCMPERFDGPEVFRQATEWLRANGSQPFYLFVHTYDVHDRCPFIMPGTSPWEGFSALTPERHQELLAYYDSLIARTDQRLAELMATLAGLERTDDTVVIVTSDHGDAFSEHGQRSHGCKLKPYEGLARVPLLVRGPQAPAGTRVAQPVSLIDVAPTILAMLGLPPEPWMRGGILPGLDLPGARTAPAVYTQCGDILAVRAGADKMITSRNRAFADEVFDLGSDPEESRNLADPFDSRTKALRRLADEYWATAVGDTPSPTNAHPTQIDEETRERLRALGYTE